MKLARIIASSSQNSVLISVYVSTYAQTRTLTPVFLVFWHGDIWVLGVWCRTQALLYVPCPNLSCFMLGYSRATLMERQMALRVPSPPLW